MFGKATATFCADAWSCTSLNDGNDIHGSLQQRLQSATLQQRVRGAVLGTPEGVHWALLLVFGTRLAWWSGQECKAQTAGDTYDWPYPVEMKSGGFVVPFLHRHADQIAQWAEMPVE